MLKILYRELDLFLLVSNTYLTRLSQVSYLSGALKLSDLRKVTWLDYLLNRVLIRQQLGHVIDCFYICKFTPWP